MSQIPGNQLLEAAVRQAQSNQPIEAENLFREALRLSPSDPAAWYYCGVFFASQGRLNDAGNCFQQALRLKPDFAEAHNEIGNLFKATGQVEPALACYTRAIELAPQFAAGHANLGSILESLHRFEEAIACFRTALRTDPDNSLIFLSLGASLSELGRYEEAIAAFSDSVRLNPRQPIAHYNLGNACRELGRLDEAIAAYREAILLDPGFAQAHNNLGLALALSAEPEQAVAAHRRAVELHPHRPAPHSNLLYALHFDPSSTGHTLLQEHLAWARRHAEPLKLNIRSHQNAREPERQLRVGFVSPDFRQHPVGRFILPLFACHDRVRYQFFSYSDVVTPDSITAQLQRESDQWRMTRGLSDQELADLVRNDQIDILVDLTMHMKGSRLLVFARKPAPVQVTYLAYCSTTGLDTMDYRVTDRFLDPPDADTSCYTEKSLRLQSYWSYQASEDAPAVNALPALSAGEVTFGSLNSFAKVSLNSLRLWAQVLGAVPHSRLLLHASPGSHREKVRGIFAESGIEAARIEFCSYVRPSDYFKLYHQIDIALDPFPYNGGTTTCDALWMGLPVITLAGKLAFGRHGVSILSNLGHPEWIANGGDEYVSIASRLAGNTTGLSEHRRSLREAMRSSPLMDAGAFARDMESAFRAMWRNHCV